MGVLLYVAGVITGGGLMYLHYKTIYKAVNAERAKYQRRLQELEAERRATDCADAFRRGVQKGRFSPAIYAERFAKTFEDRRVEFKGAR